MPQSPASRLSAPPLVEEPRLALTPQDLFPSPRPTPAPLLSGRLLFPLAPLTRPRTPQPQAYIRLQDAGGAGAAFPHAGGSRAALGTIAVIHAKSAFRAPQPEQHLPDDPKPDEKIVSPTREPQEELEREMKAVGFVEEADDGALGGDDTLSLKASQKKIDGLKIMMPVPSPRPTNGQIVVPGYKYLGKRGWLTLSMN